MPIGGRVRIYRQFLRDLFRDSSMTVTTGYFDPFEDHNNGEGDDYTGFYYISFE